MYYVLNIKNYSADAHMYQWKVVKGVKAMTEARAISENIKAKWNFGFQQTFSISQHKEHARRRRRPCHNVDDKNKNINVS